MSLIHPIPAGETMLARVPVFWTDSPAGRPNRLANLYCTERNVLLGQGRIHPYAGLVLWPIFGLVGLAAAGVWGALGAGAVLLALLAFQPRRIVGTLPIAAISRCTFVPSRGRRRLTDRDVITLTGGGDLAWRLTTSRRSSTSAKPIIEALRTIGVAVEPI